jgi:hypothetical protein
LVEFITFPAVDTVPGFQNPARWIHRYGSSSDPPEFHGDAVLSGFAFSRGSFNATDIVPDSAVPSSYWRPRPVPQAWVVVPAEFNDTDDDPGAFGGPAV